MESVRIRRCPSHRKSYSNCTAESGETGAKSGPGGPTREPRRKCKTTPNRDKFFTSDGGEFIAGWSSLVARRAQHHALKINSFLLFIQQLYSKICICTGDL